MAGAIVSILSGGALSGVASVINAIRGKNPEDAAKLAEILERNKEAILAAESAALKGQTDTNTEEAKSSNFFIAGWRPFVGWTCGSAFAYAFVIQPLLVFILVASHSTFDAASLPKLDISTMSTVLLGMLGLAAARTVEKVNGVSDGH